MSYHNININLLHRLNGLKPLHNKTNNDNKSSLASHKSLDILPAYSNSSVHCSFGIPELNHSKKNFLRKVNKTKYKQKPQQQQRKQHKNNNTMFNNSSSSLANPLAFLSSIIAQKQEEESIVSSAYKEAPAESIPDLLNPLQFLSLIPAVAPQSASFDHTNNRNNTASSCKKRQAVPHLNSCPIIDCWTEVATDEEMRDHINSAHEKLICFSCLALFELWQIAALARHLNEHKEAGSKYYCDYCGASYNKKSSCFTHKTAHRQPHKRQVGNLLNAQSTASANNTRSNNQRKKNNDRNNNSVENPLAFLTKPCEAQQPVRKPVNLNGSSCGRGGHNVNPLHFLATTNFSVASNDIAGLFSADSVRS
jgi:hypothetical protein